MGGHPLVQGPPQSGAGGRQEPRLTVQAGGEGALQAPRQGGLRKNSHTALGHQVAEGFETGRGIQGAVREHHIQIVGGQGSQQAIGSVLTGEQPGRLGHL